MNILVKQRGLTLIELMIAITLSAIITLAIASLFIQSRRSNEQNDIIAHMQENGRFAMQFLREDLIHTGFFGDMNDPSDITTGSLPTQTTSCNSPTWYTTVSNLSDRIRYNDDVSSANALYDCISDATFITHGNILMIKRTKGNPGDNNTAATADNKIYLRTNGKSGVIYQFDNADNIPSIGGESTDWQYYVNIYYVANNTTASPPIPTLYRYELQNGNMISVPLVDNIEYFQVQFGIDSDDDSISNYYTSAPDTTEMDKAVSARIYVLVRAEKSTQGYVNTKTYHFADGLAIGPKNDGYYRRLYTTTVVLKNPLHQRMMGAQ